MLILTFERRYEALPATCCYLCVHQFGPIFYVLPLLLIGLPASPSYPASEHPVGDHPVSFNWNDGPAGVVKGLGAEPVHLKLTLKVKHPGIFFSAVNGRSPNDGSLWPKPASVTGTRLLLVGFSLL
jgi:hypothetical protein